MRLRTVLVLFAAISATNGVVAILAPGPLMHAIWPDRPTAGAEVFVRGWGACLLALAGMAWTNRNAQDPFVRRSICQALFIYFGITAAVWVADARAIGWTIMSVLTFIILSAFASAFGYIRYLKLTRVGALG